MQVSHQRRMDFRTLANTPRISLKSPARRQSSQPWPRRSRRSLRKQDSSYDPRGKSLDWSGQACVLPVYRSTPSNISRWICCIQSTSHICAEMCRRSVMLEPHTSLYLGWNTL
ncbi:hypothetical protein TNCV_4123061 [Trichonephila clavipes]|nr:hypothetical protein TNCV_4123061 [Trichonephila clavipes]